MVPLWNNLPADVALSPPSYFKSRLRQLSVLHGFRHQGCFGGLTPPPPPDFQALYYTLYIGMAKIVELKHNSGCHQSKHRFMIVVAKDAPKN